MLAEHDLAFLEHLRAEADTTFEEPNRVVKARAFIDKLLAGSSDLSLKRKASIYALDRALVEVASSAELHAWGCELYRRYCKERGLEVSETDPTMRRPEAGSQETADEVNALRARLHQLLRAMHWSYEFGPLREKQRVWLIQGAMVVMIAATAILATLLAVIRQAGGGDGLPFFAMLCAVVYAGIMGGLVSCVKRVSEVSAKDDALVSIYALENSRYVLYFAPLSGAVFAVIAMLLFMGRILSGSLFPSFPELKVTEALPTDWVFTRTLVPADSKDYALLLLWCFIAGFAERFIPDTISDLARRAKDSAEPSKDSEGQAATDGKAARPAG